MSTISAILTAAPDGTLHLPLPEGWRNSRVKVVAQVERVGEEAPQESLKGFGALRGKISMAPDFDEPLADFKEYLG
jgi:hypothetical protein